MTRLQTNQKKRTEIVVNYDRFRRLCGLYSFAVSIRHCNSNVLLALAHIWRCEQSGPIQLIEIQKIEGIKCYICAVRECLKVARRRAYYLILRKV